MLKNFQSLIVFLLLGLSLGGLPSLAGAPKSGGGGAHPPGEMLVDGFEVTVFAAPPEIEYPTALAAAPDGTVYVSVDRDGSLGRAYSGKVVACRDEDGDGQADRFWDYIPEVESPRGGQMINGRFYLIHPPYLSVYWDEDGDGVAEQSQQLVDGLGASVQEMRGGDHTTNGVRMGIDGWLYIAVGDFGMSSATGTDGREVTLRGGGVARVRPDGSGLEVYSYFTRNQCDVAISPYLDQFARDNTNDGKGWNIRIHHYSNLSNHGYPNLYKNFSDEVVKPLLDLGGGSGTGALYLHEPGFPQGFGDRLYTCDWTTGKIYHHELEPVAATFQLEQEEWMTLSRATDIDVDGESRLYTADWRGGRFSYGGAERPVGLIHRVVPEGYQAEKWPDLDGLGEAALISQLGHRSGVRRLQAQQILVRRGKSETVGDALLAMARSEVPLYGKVAAIFGYQQILREEASAGLVSLLADDEVREFAVRALGDERGLRSGLSQEQFEVLLEDANPRVRLQAAIAIERGGRVDLAGALLQAGAARYQALAGLEGVEDERFPHTVVEVLAFLRAEEVCLAAIADVETRGIALAALKKMSTAGVVAGLEKVLANAGSDHELRLQVMAVMARLVHREGAWDERAWWGTRPDDRGPYFTPEKWAESERATEALEGAFGQLLAGDRERALALLAVNRLDATQMNLGKLDPVLMALGAVSGTGSDNGAQLDVLAKAALDPRRKWEQRLACYRAVSRSDNEAALREQLVILAGWGQDEALAEVYSREVNEFINAPALILRLNDLLRLGNQEEPALSQIAWQAILTFSRSPLIKVRFAERAKSIAQDNPRALGFFHALGEMKLAGFEGPIAHAMAGDNTALIEAATAAKKAIESAAGASQGALVMTLAAGDVTEQIMAMAGQGDLVLGQKLFIQQACASCHAVSLAEVQKGPYLGSAGSKFTRDYLIESILAPEATVAQGFRTQLITMSDGGVHMGFVTREEDGEIDVRNIGGVVVTVQESEVKSRIEQTQSMMPPGLGSSLTVVELNALIDYLGSLREE